MRGVDQFVRLRADQFEQVVEFNREVDRLADLAENIQFLHAPFQRFDHLGTFSGNAQLRRQILQEQQFFIFIRSRAGTRRPHTDETV